MSENSVIWEIRSQKIKFLQEYYIIAPRILYLLFIRIRILEESLLIGLQIDNFTNFFFNGKLSRYSKIFYLIIFYFNINKYIK